MNDRDSDLLADWLAFALAEAEAGRAVDVDAVCAERPDLAGELRAALGLRHGLAALHRTEAEAPIDAGRVLADRYRLVAPIGSGASGTVWLATDRRLGREVAVKLLHRNLFHGDDSRLRFQREAVVLAAHEHAHVVRIYDQGQADDGTMFLVTERLRGRSLHDLLQAAAAAMPAGPSLVAFADLGWLQQLLPDAALEPTFLRQAVRWVAELGDGLAVAHADGICHRDVKPSNAFVRDDGRAVLLDFGIAARTGDAGLTRTHTVLGTPSYMAPEQAAGNSEPHPALDVYGLTATLYHLLTLRPPHQGDLQDVLVSLRLEDPVRADRVCRGLPRDLQAVLDRGLDRQPARRYASMQDLVADLRAFLAHAPVAARPLAAGTRLWRRVARRPARAVAIAATALAVVGGGIAVPAVLALRAHAAERERDERLARLPADLCIEGRPDQRALVPIDERDATLAELDALLRLDAGDDGAGWDVAIRLLRATTRLDHGDVAGARADFAAIATAAGNAAGNAADVAAGDDSGDDPAGGDAFVRALAARYATAATGDAGSILLDLDGLPEPTTAVSCFLAGFHALRAWDCARADALLARAGDYLPAQDLRLLALIGKQPPDPEAAIEAASRLEGRYGRATARTRHTLAAAHLQLRHYEDAIPHCERALALRPDRHGPWNNLGLAHLRLGHLDDALRCYRRAVALRPWFDNSLSGLCQTLRAFGRTDEARDAAERIGNVGWREYELGMVELAQCLHALAAQDGDAQRAAARVAAAHFAAAEAAADTEATTRARARINRVLADAFASDDRQAALVPFLAALRADPRNPRQIGNLADLLQGTPLGDDARGRLCLWLYDLAIDLAPDDGSLRRQRADLLEALRRRTFR